MSETIVIEIPSEHKSLADAIGILLTKVGEQCQAARSGQALDYVSVEEELREQAGVIERSAHEAILSSAVLDLEARVIEMRGRSFVQVCRSKGRYRTQTGVVAFDRPLFRERGVRNGPTLDPILMRIGGVGDGWLPGTAKAMAHLMQLGTSREAAETARQMGRLPYSRTSFERVPHLVGELYVARREGIEQELISEYEVPVDAHAVSVSIDRVSLPMEEPRPRPRGRPAKNAPKNPITRQFRMAYCATATVHDEDGKALHTIRYGRMPLGDEVGLAEALASDVIAMRKKRPDLEVVRLADGAHEMWNLLETAVDDEGVGTQCTSLVDYWHLIEKLSPAAKALDGEDAEATRKRWGERLLKSEGAAASILRELRAAEPAPLRSDDEDPIAHAISYIENHRKRMNYADARARGLPIGSGNIEATCKSLVQVRMKRSGSRWKEDTGDHVLQLRALALSDRWDAAMDKVFRAQRCEVRPLAA